MAKRPCRWRITGAWAPARASSARMTSWRRAIPANRPIPDREGRAPSGRGHSLHLHYAVPGIIALHPHPLFHMVDGHAQQHQAETAAPIALEQEARSEEHTSELQSLMR